MTYYWKQESEFKLEKCRSLASFQKDPYTQKMSNIESSRPKLQSIRQKKGEAINQNVQHNYQSFRTLGRVKSVDQISRIKEAISFENMIQAYKKENENLKQQNKFLIKQVKKKQKNEQILSNYIQQLRKQIKKIQRNSSTSPLSPRPKNFNNFNNVKSSKPETQRHQRSDEVYLRATKTLDEGQTWSTMHEIDQLNERFNSLMDQCSKQTCKNTRNILRGKLAETAERMKNFKKEFNMV